MPAMAAARRAKENFMVVDWRALILLERWKELVAESCLC